VSRSDGGLDPTTETETLAIAVDDAAISAARSLGATAETETLIGLGLVITRFRSPDAATNRSVRERLEDLAPGNEVAPNNVFQPLSVLTPDRRIGGWVEVEAAGPCVRDTLVGMVDTGFVDAAPPDGVTVAAFPDRTDWPPYRDRHGTVVGELVRTLTGGPLFAANAFSVDARGRPLATALSLIRSLDWLVRQRVAIINLSLAGPPNPLLETALSRVDELGVQVVAAAGNGGPLAEPAYPAAYRTTLAVAAHDRSLSPFPQGNRGTYIDLSAPGVALRTGDPKARSGTSLAAALVSASLAAAPHDAPAARRDWLLRRLIDLGPDGHDQIYGWGALARPVACALERS
jgi:hypothetical protein